MFAGLGVNALPIRWCFWAIAPHYNIYAAAIRLHEGDLMP
jgi:hypothetical protein